MTPEQSAVEPAVRRPHVQAVFRRSRVSSSSFANATNSDERVFAISRASSGDASLTARSINTVSGADVAVTLEANSSADIPPTTLGPSSSIVRCASVRPVRSFV